MTCDELAPLLPSLGDPGLKPAQEKALRAHLESCESCRATLAGFGRLQELLDAGMPVPDPGAAFFKAQRERILARAGSAATEKFRRPRGLRFVWATAAAILILAAGAAFWYGVPSLSPVPGSTMGTSESSGIPPAPVASGPPASPNPAPRAQEKPSQAPDLGPAPPRTLPTPDPKVASDLPGKSPVPKETPSMVAPGTAARLSMMTNESVDIGLAETPHERVVALFGAAEARLKEVGQVMREDPGLASELAAAYLLLLREGVRAVLKDDSEPPQELALARLAAAERAKNQQGALVQLGSAAQGPLKGTLEEALAMSRELAKP